MPSDAFKSLQLGLHEIVDLLRADPTPKGGISPDPPVSRAVLRSAVVILCSHFERYLRSVNEESISLINDSNVAYGLIPETLRLEHSRDAIDSLAKTEWSNRAKGLIDYTSNDAWLWGTADKGNLDHRHVIQWMRSPAPKYIARFYRTWGIEDIFSSITRKSHTKRRFYLKIKEFVEKRHNIAHGDFATEATIDEVREYQFVIRLFCDRVDRRLFRILSSELGLPCSWY